MTVLIEHETCQCQCQIRKTNERMKIKLIYFIYKYNYVIIIIFLNYETSSCVFVHFYQIWIISSFVIIFGKFKKLIDMLLKTL